MNSRAFASLLLAACPTLVACGAVHAGGTPAFEQGMLNATWYGAYHRPLAPDEASPRESRAEEAVAAREERPARAERPRATEPAPATVVAAASSAPPIPQSNADASYDTDLAAAYVRAVYAMNETSVGPDQGGIVDIYRHAQTEGRIYHTTRPAIGDLVFFHNTFDRNGDGRNNDWYTHVAIVESVDDAGNVGVLSYVDGRVARTWLNVESPDAARVGGVDANTAMRRERASDPEYTAYLAGELFAGFGSLLGNRTQVMVIDDWQPGEARVADAR